MNVDKQCSMSLTIIEAAEQPRNHILFYVITAVKFHCILVHIMF